MTPDLGARLFAAYADTFKPEQAAEFWDAYKKVPDSDQKVLRQAVIAAELAGKKQKNGAIWAQRNTALAAQLSTRTWQIDPKELPLSYMSRIRLVSSLKLHLRWVQRLAEAWSAKDTNLICDLEYPLLSQMAAAGGSVGATAERRLDAVVAQLLPELFKHDESCALSLLELEAIRLRVKPEGLAKQYLARQNWPLVGGFLHLYWTMAEHVYDGGDPKGAREMWKVLRDKGTPGSPEVGFAKVRLDPTQTELEKLWN